MVPIDVFSGFLGTGKTTLIKALFNHEKFKKQKILVIQCECGEEELELEEASWVRQIQVESPEIMNAHFWKQIKQNVQPERIIIEYNGTWKMESLLMQKLPRSYQIRSIVNVLAADTFQPYLKNMGEMLIGPITESDYVLVTHSEDETKKRLSALKNSVQKLNHGVNLRMLTQEEKSAQSLIEEILAEDEDYVQQKIYHTMQAVCILLAFLIIGLSIQMLQVTGQMDVLKGIQRIHSVFIGMLLEMISFILIGTVVASLLQVLVSEQHLMKFLGKHQILSFPLAILLGICFPVCDCALVPIAARLIKKGVSMLHTMLFMLAAMVVNPIVLLSTYYAFSNQPQVIFYRLGMGIALAILMSSLLGYLFRKGDKPRNVQKTSSILMSEVAINICSSGYMGEGCFKGKMGKVEAVIRHTTMEFLYIMPLAMGGALISSVIQTIYRGQIEGGQYHGIIAFGIVLIAAMIMSICGNSNAFMARGLVGILPLGHVVAFMVLGPVLDLKNLILMSGHFNKRFIGFYLIGAVLIGFGLVTVCGWM